MKGKLVVLSVLTLFILTLLSFTEKYAEKKDLKIDSGTPTSRLSLFGEYIFKREQCENCHSLNISDNDSKISLDGLQGKFPFSWHYLHLIDPTIMVPSSQMPSFAHLSDNIFELDSVEKHVDKLSKQEWNNLVTHAQTINIELKEFGINSKWNSELVALICFLDDIPQSTESKLLRTKEIENSIRENKIRDSIWASSGIVIENVLRDSGSITLGKVVFGVNCTPCHGSSGEGVVGPNLCDDYWLHGGKDKNILNTIVNGVPDKGMIAWKNRLSPIEVGQVVAYIKSIKGSNPRNPKESQGIKD